MMMRRSVVRRLNAALARIEPLDVPLATGGRLPTVLDRVDEAVEQTASRLDEAGATAARLESALHEVAQGVVICDEQGRVVFRNRRAAAFAGARHGEALAER